MKPILAALLAASAHVAHPYAAEANDALRGRFALEQKWQDNAKGVCRGVDAAMAQRLASAKLRCAAKPTSGTASGRPAVVCSGDRIEILVFRSQADSEQEIRAVKANND